MQNWPSLTAAVPVPGDVNDVVHGMYLPPSNALFLRRSCPESAGTCTPGEPFVGAAFQSIIDGSTAAAAGGVAAGAAAGAVAGVAAGAVDCAAGVVQAASASAAKRN